MLVERDRVYRVGFSVHLLCYAVIVLYFTPRTFQRNASLAVAGPP